MAGMPELFVDDRKQGDRGAPPTGAALLIEFRRENSERAVAATNCITRDVVVAVFFDACRGPDEPAEFRQQGFIGMSDAALRQRLGVEVYRFVVIECEWQGFQRLLDRGHLARVAAAPTPPP